jgi:hypothetical protein
LERKGTWKAGHLKGRALGEEVGKGGESFWKGGVLLERKDSSWRKADLSGNNETPVGNRTPAPVTDRTG